MEEMLTNQPPSLEVGSLLAKRFRIDQLIGSGGMGDVYRAFDLRTEKPCALKIVRKDSAFGRHAAIRMRREAECTARLFHPNIVEVLETHETESGLFYIVMELLEGQDLQSLLRTHPKLSLVRTLEIVRPIASALYAAHCIGIVHRDVKPSNVFLSYPNGTATEVPKLLDFGLARRIGDSLRSTGLTKDLVIGTIEYLSPEATEPSQLQLDARTDQWSLAVMVFRMLSGYLPFDYPDPLIQCLRIRTREAPPLSRFVSGLPTHVPATIERALRKNKHERFSSILDFLRSLEGRTPLALDETTLPLPTRLPVTRLHAASTLSSVGALPTEEKVTLPIPSWNRKVGGAGLVGGVALVLGFYSALTEPSAKPVQLETIAPENASVAMPAGDIFQMEQDSPCTFMPPENLAPSAPDADTPVIAQQPAAGQAVEPKSGYRTASTTAHAKRSVSSTPRKSSKRPVQAPPEPRRIQIVD